MTGRLSGGCPPNLHAKVRHIDCRRICQPHRQGRSMPIPWAGSAILDALEIVRIGPRHSAEQARGRARRCSHTINRVSPLATRADAAGASSRCRAHRQVVVITAARSRWRAPHGAGHHWRRAVVAAATPRPLAGIAFTKAAGAGCPGDLWRFLQCRHEVGRAGPSDAGIMKAGHGGGQLARPLQACPTRPPTPVRPNTLTPSRRNESMMSRGPWSRAA